MNGSADVDVASAAVRSERSVCLALYAVKRWLTALPLSSSIIGEGVVHTC